MNVGQLRVLFSLFHKPGLKWGIASATGYSVRYVENALQWLMACGFVHSFRRGIAGKPHSIGNYMLTPLGRDYATKLRSTLTPTEIERLLTPRKGKSGSRTKPKPSALGDSLGL